LCTEPWCGCDVGALAVGDHDKVGHPRAALGKIRHEVRQWGAHRKVAQRRTRQPVREDDLALCGHRHESGAADLTAGAHEVLQRGDVRLGRTLFGERGT
jgi:hypothetical protein